MVEGHDQASARSTPLIEARGVRKTYDIRSMPVEVLTGADFAINRGEWVAILGSSGSGKSTLMHLLGGLDRPDQGGGEIRFEGQPVAITHGSRLDSYRNRDIGFVFQFYHLLPELSVLENTMLPAMVGRWFKGVRRDGVTWGRARDDARSLLNSFGLSHRISHKPSQLSGGERQRVAIARALVNGPRVLLADEPTGNLDAVTGAGILDLLAARHAKGLTIVMVTHDSEVAARADRIVRLSNGRVATPHS